MAPLHPIRSHNEPAFNIQYAGMCTCLLVCLLCLLFVVCCLSCVLLVCLLLVCLLFVVCVCLYSVCMSCGSFCVCCWLASSPIISPLLSLTFVRFGTCCRLCAHSHIIQEAASRCIAR